MLSFFKPKSYSLFEKGALMNFDIFFIRIRMRMDNKIFDRLFGFMSRLDYYYPILILLFLFILFQVNNLNIIWQMLILLIISDQTCKWFFKRQFIRMRPYKWLMVESVRQNRELPEKLIFAKFDHIYSWVSFSSMCSSHSANFFAQSLLISHYSLNLGYWLIPIFMLVGIGRWYIGAHWVSDILVGWFVGFCSYLIIINMIPLIKTIID